MDKEMSMKIILVFISLFVGVVSASCGDSDVTSGPDDRDELIARAGAPLFDGMGDHQRAITTSSSEAQRYFDQGMVLAFGFNHAEAIRSFRAAQRLDDQCAMCYWGEALATGPNINVTSNGKAIMSPDDRVAAFAAAQRAVSFVLVGRNYVVASGLDRGARIVSFLIEIPEYGSQSTLADFIIRQAKCVWCY